ncbi:penicillin acylase family protein [Flectobacillus major]|uniref:penicillin acylase family protein n=1 Tax=Flectobacillus major TaxID=103 RepID=UPI0004080CFC|nr:penicillin acylase family protein [Flectobacillus major]
MKKIALLLLLLPFQFFAQSFSKTEIARWEKQAKQVQIIRDHWGIPHIYGKTDADAVFGLLYAQCEDDFKRVELNYIEKLGRLSEIKGESELYNDLLIRMLIDSAEAIADYKKAPIWLKKLLNAHADAINYYIYKNPQVKPALLTRFQPWYSLLWTDGSIGAINTADLTTHDLKNLYDGKDVVGAISPKKVEEEILTGSNGFAFSPKITASGKAILYINPHVTFYFRPEVHVVSQEGLNAYGAVTWGQFFVYQGFNEHCGWMHTSSYTDISDTYIEKLDKKNQKWYYTYDNTQKPVIERKINLGVLKGGTIEQKSFDALFTHHGPIMAKRNGQWLSMKANNRSMVGLIQSWQRTKTKSFAEYKKVMGLLANTSNNTVYADAEGNIAYWHGNFLPIRDTKFDWSKPVDGTTSATEWKGLHKVDESVHVYNPSNGWLQNCNATPYTVAGINSPKRKDFPKYMAPDGENFRGINAVRVLNSYQDYTLDKVIAAGYDTYLAAFRVLVPALVKAFEQSVPTADPRYIELAEPIAQLKAWDYRCSTTSVPTSLAIEWGQRLLPAIQKVQVADEEKADQVGKTTQFAATASPNDLLGPFKETITELKTKFGTWQVAWGEINRFQRISSDIDQQYDDTKPSIPVPFASSAWGMLPSYTGRYFAGTKKRYGVNGNSFICAVEFGTKIKAKSLLAGGQSGDMLSKHFNDQAEMYTKGQFKDVLFYKDDIVKHAEKTYFPGQK